MHESFITSDWLTLDFALAVAVEDAGIQPYLCLTLKKGVGERESCCLKSRTSAGVINSFLAKLSSRAPCG